MMVAALGQTLQTRRRERGLTLEALAAQAGVHKSTLSRWERGKTVPFVHELTRVVDVLGLGQKERQVCYQSLEAPRAVHIADAGATDALPVSSGELLRVLRRRAQLSQTAIAHAANVSQNLVVKWEKGEVWPNSEQLHAFCFAIGATEDEFVFLTTRAWRYMEPLPLDKDALDAVIWRLEHYDTTTTRAATYLALAARYHTLYRAGKISEVEATSVYGNYAYYLAWRLHRFHDAGRIAAPVFEGLRRSHGHSRDKLTQGQIDAVSLWIEHGDKFGKGALEDKLNVLSSVSGRFPPINRAWHTDLIAMAWEKAGNHDASATYFRQSIALAMTRAGAVLRRDRFINALCRQGRFSEAASLLTLTPSDEKRAGIKAQNLFQHAQVFAGLADFGAAERYLARAVTYARAQNLTHFANEAGEIARAIEAGRSRRK